MFYCNDLGNEPIHDPVGVGLALRNNVSINEAVRFAASNNLMGIICSSKLLVRKPLNTTFDMTKFQKTNHAFADIGTSTHPESERSRFGGCRTYFRRLYL